jgi:hypothetical protein
MFSGWSAIFDPRLTDLPFYRWIRGTDYLGPRMLQTGGVLVVMAAIGAAALVAARVLGPRLENTRIKRGAVAGFAIVAGVLFLPLAARVSLGALDFAAAVTGWIDPLWTLLRNKPVTLPLPFLLAALIVLHVYWLVRPRKDLPAVKVAARIVVLVFALAMLAKILFYVRFEHYGFVLSVAGTVVLIAAAVDWVPGVLPWKNGAAVFRWAMLLVVALVVAARCPIARGPQQTYRAGGETFKEHPRFVHMQRAVEYLEEHASAGQTVAVLPEGAMVNFLSRRANSTRYFNVLPLEYLLYGGDHILQAFEKHPPDYVILVHRTTAEYGMPLFGSDYAPELMEWIRGEYHRVALFGDPPLRTMEAELFGVEILVRSGEGGGGSREEGKK